jgi:hypothetical protein
MFAVNFAFKIFKIGFINFFIIRKKFNFKIPPHLRFIKI